jgi:hypothetical protein
MEPTNGSVESSRATRSEEKVAEKLYEEAVGDISPETPSTDGDQVPDEAQTREERT